MSFFVRSNPDGADAPECPARIGATVYISDYISCEMVTSNCGKCSCILGNRCRLAPARPLEKYRVETEAETHPLNSSVIRLERIAGDCHISVIIM